MFPIGGKEKRQVMSVLKIGGIPVALEIGGTDKTGRIPELTAADISPAGISVTPIDLSRTRSNSIQTRFRLHYPARGRIEHLPENEVQLGRTVLHVAHIVQKQFSKTEVGRSEHVGPG